MRRTTVATAAALIVVLAVIGAGQAGAYGPKPTQAIDNAAQFLGACAAVA